MRAKRLKGISIALSSLTDTSQRRFIGFMPPTVTLCAPVKVEAELTVSRWDQFHN
jgi:hypothetical protein